MSGVHAAVGFATLAAAVIAATWGGVAWLRGIPSTLFWPVLRIAQALVAVEVVFGLVLLATGRKVPDGLHYFYGVAPLVVNVVAEGLRVNAAAAELEGIDDFDALTRKQQVLLARSIVMREIGIMTIATLLVVTLLLRAAEIF